MRKLQEIQSDISAVDGQIAELYQKRRMFTKEAAEQGEAPAGNVFGFTLQDAFDFTDAKVVFQGVEIGRASCRERV